MQTNFSIDENRVDTLHANLLPELVDLVVVTNGYRESLRFLPIRFYEGQVQPLHEKRKRTITNNR